MNIKRILAAIAIALVVAVLSISIKYGCFGHSSSGKDIPEDQIQITID